MNLFFPPIAPLRTHFDKEVRRPSIVVIYQRDKRGRLVLTRAVVPKRAVA